MINAEVTIDPEDRHRLNISLRRGWASLMGIVQLEDEQDEEFRARLLETIYGPSPNAWEYYDSTSLDVEYMRKAVTNITNETFTLWLRAWGMPKSSTRDDLRERVLLPGAGDVCAPDLAEELSIAIRGDVKGIPKELRAQSRTVPCEIERGGDYFGLTEDELWLRDLLRGI